MRTHPITIARTIADAALVLVMAAFVASLASGVGPGATSWVWILGVTVGAGIAGQIATSLIWRRGLEAAWDELVQASHAASYVFGYWAVMATFLTIYALVEADVMSAEAAFFWLAPVLGAAPSAWMLLASLRGRAG